MTIHKHREEKAFIAGAIVLAVLFLGWTIWFTVEHDKALDKYEQYCEKVGWSVCEREAGLN